MSECEYHFKFLKIKIYITTFVRESHSYRINFTGGREIENLLTIKHHLFCICIEIIFYQIILGTGSMVTECRKCEIWSLTGGWCSVCDWLSFNHISLATAPLSPRRTSIIFCCQLMKIADTPLVARARENIKPARPTLTLNRKIMKYFLRNILLDAI